MERTNAQANGRKLVLGFNAGCMTCSGLSKKIEEAVGDRLEVRSLHEPQVEHGVRKLWGLMHLGLLRLSRLTVSWCAHGPAQGCA